MTKARIYFTLIFTISVALKYYRSTRLFSSSFLKKFILLRWESDCQRFYWMITSNAFFFLLEIPQVEVWLSILLRGSNFYMTLLSPTQHLKISMYLLWLIWQWQIFLNAVREYLWNKNIYWWVCFGKGLTSAIHSSGVKLEGFFSFLKILLPLYLKCCLLDMQVYS